MLRSIPTFVSRVVREIVSRMRNEFSCVEGGDWDNVSVSGWLLWAPSLRRHVHE